MMVSFFPQGVLDEILNLIGSVSEGFPSYSYYYEPENKAQSRQWVGSGTQRPKKFKTQLSAGKVMATVFWDAKCVITLDFLSKRSIITRACYSYLLDQLRTAIREKRRPRQTL